MARLIKYPAICFYCKKNFPKGKAYLQRNKGVWLCQCFDCYKRRKEEQEGEELLKPFKNMRKQ